MSFKQPKCKLENAKQSCIGSIKNLDLRASPI